MLPNWSRRQFLTAPLVALPNALPAQTPHSLLLAACDDAQGQHFVQAVRLNGQRVWQLQLQFRAHAIAVHPSQPLAAVFARRPGTSVLLIDYQRGHVLAQIDSVTARHFYGHGCFSHDGTLLYCSENAYEQQQGVIGIYAVPSLQRQGELSSYGIGTHQIVLHPDKQHLVLANGGILTHPDLPRRKLNLASMSPSLTYIECNSGQLAQQFQLPAQHASIRHLSINADGLVALAMQQQVPRSVPLVAFQQGQQSIQSCQAPANIWATMHYYTASICLATDQPIAAVTCPRGHLVSFWHSLERRYLQHIELADAGGVLYTNSAFWVSTGLGEWVEIAVPSLTIRHRQQHSQWRWDNHCSLAMV